MWLPPQTGRWHQIRKHLNGLSHPILGDAHGDSRVNHWWREEFDFRHLDYIATSCS